MTFADGHVFAHMTGERHTTESLEAGDFAEAGWVDPDWSMTVLHESRNDVRPVVSERRDSEDLADYCREALGHLGAYEDNGDGTFYAIDSQTFDYTTDDTFTYALHFTLKFRGAKGYEERRWHPSEAGIELS